MNTSPHRSLAALLIGATAIGQLILGPSVPVYAESSSPQALTCNAISGFVYEDANFNGLREANEPPLADVPVELVNIADTTIATATTDASGFYSFTIDATILQASRHVTYTFPISQRTTDWTSQVQVPQFDPAVGDLLAVAITSTGQLTTLVRVENTDTSAQVLTATVAARFTTGGPALGSVVAQSPLEFIGVFNAGPFDGLIDFKGASGFIYPAKTVSATANVTVSDPASLALYTGAGTLTMSLSTVGSSSAVGSSNVNLLLATSAEGGLQVDYGYIPSRCIKAGTYTVHEHQPPAYDDGLDTNGNVTPIPGSSDGHDIITVQVTTGDDRPNNNFGEWRHSSIGGFVYHDISDDGAFDTSESPITGVQIKLTGRTISGTLVSLTQTTGLDGMYDFTGLWAGTYTLTEVQPPTWDDGKDTQGTPGSGIATNDQFAVIKLDSGVDGKNNNFGELLPTPSLSLTKTVGTLPNTCALTNEITVTAGTPVYYCYTLTNTGKISLVTHTLVDDKLGVLLNDVVINLAPGASTFVTAPATIQITTTNVATWTARPPVGPPIVITTTAKVRVPPVQATAALGDFVWMDTDNDGIQDKDEPGAAKTRVTLYANGAPVSTTVTTWQGYYTFTQLTPGVPYTVHFDYDMKQGMTWTVRYAGTNRAKDSNIDKHGNTEAIVLKDGEFNRTIDAGIDLGLVIDQVAVDGFLAVSPCPDRLITYTLVVDNNGIFTLSDIMLYDQVPTNTTYIPGSATVPPTVEQSSLVWQLPTLRPGDRFSVSFTVKVTIDDVVSVVNSAYIGNTDFPVLSTTVNDKQLTCNDRPTAISLLRFEATPMKEGVRVEWGTSLEQDTMGFAIYRSTDVQREHASRMNSDLIVSNGRDGGARYEWVDTSAQADTRYYYWLQEMTLAGSTQDYGPIASTGVDGNAASVLSGGGMVLPTVMPTPVLPAAERIADVAVAAPVQIVKVVAQPVSQATLVPMIVDNAASVNRVDIAPTTVVAQVQSKLTHSATPIVSVVQAVTPAPVIGQADYQSVMPRDLALVSMVASSNVEMAIPSTQVLPAIAAAPVVTATETSLDSGWITYLMLFSGAGAIVAIGLGWAMFAVMGRRWWQ